MPGIKLFVHQYHQLLKAAIQSVRESLPDGVVDEEKKKLESGSQLSLVA